MSPDELLAPKVGGVEPTSSDEVNEPLIAASGVSKAFRLFASPLDRLREALSPWGRSYHREFFALQDVSFKVHRGESLALIGRNGSGKSTLLKLITGILLPSSGELSVRGRIGALLELGAGFNLEYSGVENVLLNATIHGLTEREAKARLPEILAFADIGEFAYRPCKSYSSGMFARLAFAAMIHFDPDILIVDEALAVGDVFFQQKCFRWMKERMASVTKILVSHDMHSVAQLASRAILLEAGRVTFDGEPIAAIEKYTKQLHNDLFAKTEQAPGQEEPAPNVARASNENLADLLPINAESLGGALDACIVAYRLTVAGSKTDLVRTAETIEITLQLQSKRAIAEGIVGVSVADKYGQNVFGVNSLGARLAANIPMGNSYVRIRFAWPLIKEGAYFLTVGLGEGVEELDHVVQCWAHNLVVLQSIPGQPVHGLFNVAMAALEIFS